MKYRFVLILGLFCLLYPLHSNSGNSFMPEVKDVTKYVVLSAGFIYLFLNYKDQPVKVLKAIYWFSIFLIWANIPYLTGVLTPHKEVDYSYSFGITDADLGSSGAYLNPHALSVYMTSALLVIIFLMKNYPRQFKTRSPFLLLTLVIGLYALYVSFARTGWAFFLIGLVFIFLKELKVRSIIKFLPLAALFIVGLTVFIQTNESLRRRLFDEREFSSGNRQNDLGSGRFLIGSTVVSNWWEADPVTIFMGYGLDEGKDRMKKKIGMSVFAHNGILDILQRGGIVKLVLFVMFIISLYVTINRTRNVFTPMAKALFFGWIAVGLVQEFTYIYINLFVTVFLFLCVATERRIKIERLKNKEITRLQQAGDK